MSGREKGKLTIREALKRRDGAFYHRLESIWTTAQQLQERQRSKEGHQQGPLHCGAVESNLDEIIPDDKKRKFFSPLELFLFSTAACYHDIGKTGDSKEEHGVVAMKEIFDFPEKFGLTKPEGNVLSYIIGSHDTDEVFDDVPETCSLGNKIVKVKLLSALFRLADVMHTDHSRIPHICVGDVKKEEDKTRFRRLIRGCIINKNFEIEITAVPENYHDLNIIENGVSMMRKQIECIRPVLQDEGYPYKINLRFDNRKLKWEAEKGIKRSLLEMDYYTENDAAAFKGRDIESRELLNKVVASNLSLLIGNSGVGKTSLIRAGLFPILKKMEWKCIWTRPLNPDPLKQILDDINASFKENYVFNDIFQSLKKLDEDFKSGVMIAIDQFEDILHALPHEIEQMGKILRRINSKSFRNVHILISYRGDYETEIFSFLENASIIHPEKYSLRGFDKPVASDVLRNIFLENQIGIDDALIGKILDDIGKKSNNKKIYPPFIQIIAKNLIEYARLNDEVVTEYLYNKIGGVEKIIESYLFSQLDYFFSLSPSKGKNAEAILKQLIRDKVKEQRGKDELLRYINITENQLSELLDEMVKKRLIRHLGKDNYEIIHDFLASSVEKLIEDDERPLRSAIETLGTKTRSHIYNHSILDRNELVSIYLWKEKIKPSIPEKEIIMFSYLAGNGPAWWWFKNDNDVLRTYIKKGLLNKDAEVRRAAVTAFEIFGNHDDLELIKDMLEDDHPKVIRATVSAFVKLATHQDISIIKKVLNNNDFYVRRMAASALEKLGTHDDLSIIKKILYDNDTEVVRAAASALGKLGTHDDLQVIKDLILYLGPFSNFEMIEHDRSEKVDAGISAFKKLVTYDDLPIIKEMLENDDFDMKHAALVGFEKVVTHDDLPIIKEMLHNNDSYVRSEAVEIFGKLGTHDDLPIIKEMLHNNDSYVRREAVEIFGKLGTHDDLEVIKTMLNDTEWSVKRIAIEAFGKLGTHDDLEMIKPMLSDTEWNVRHEAVKTFGKLGTHNDLEVIKPMLNDTKWNVRREAVEMFGKLGTHDDLEIIKTMLNDTEWSVKRIAIEAFGKLGTHDDLEAIKPMLKDTYSDMKSVVVTTFEKLGTHDDLEMIKPMLKDTNSVVGSIALEIFRKLGTHDDLEMIKPMLKDTNISVRLAAVEIFGKLGTHDDLEVIKTMLNDTNWSVRCIAIEAFGKLGTHDDLEIIKPMLNDTNWSVRHEAVKTFEKLGTHNDLEVIKPMLNDTVWNVRYEAVEMFGKLGTHDDLEIIKTMLNDTEWSVKRIAIEAFGKLGTHNDLEIIKPMLNDIDSNVRSAAAAVIYLLANENNIKQIADQISKGEIMNSNESIDLLISLDERFYSPVKKLIFGKIK